MPPRSLSGGSALTAGRPGAITEDATIRRQMAANPGGEPGQPPSSQVLAAAAEAGRATGGVPAGGSIEGTRSRPETA